MKRHSTSKTHFGYIIGLANAIIHSEETNPFLVGHLTSYYNGEHDKKLLNVEYKLEQKKIPLGSALPPATLWVSALHATITQGGYTAPESKSSFYISKFLISPLDMPCYNCPDGQSLVRHSGSLMNLIRLPPQYF
jgi:hypothetical protein